MRNPEMTKMRDRKLVEKFYQLYMRSTAAPGSGERTGNS